MLYETLAAAGEVFNAERSHTTAQQWRKKNVRQDREKVKKN